MRPYQCLKTDSLTRAEDSPQLPDVPPERLYMASPASLPSPPNLFSRPYLFIDLSQDYASAPTQYGSEQFAQSVLQVPVGYF
jgi:hypothetical protein